MKIIGIDPGTTESAIVVWSGGKVLAANIVTNEGCLNFVRAHKSATLIAVEMVACYGMPVGREVFETCLVIGRIQEATYVNCLEGVECRLIYRRDVKLHHCQSARAKDSNIRQALVDRFGGKDKAVGIKKQQGPLYGIKSHLWAALAIAIYVSDTQNVQEVRTVQGAL